VNRHRRSWRPAAWGFGFLAAAAVGALLWSRVQGPKTEDGPPPTHPEIAIEVLNGCGVDGAADRAASELRRGGYPVDRVSDADHFHHRRDLVVIRRGDGSEAPTVSALLGGAAVIEQRIPEYGYDLTVVVGTPHPLVPER